MTDRSWLAKPNSVRIDLSLSSSHNYSDDQSLAKMSCFLPTSCLHIHTGWPVNGERVRFPPTNRFRFHRCPGFVKWRKRDFFQMKNLYEHNQKLAKDPKFGSNLSEFGSKTFRNGCATLVAILVINDRKTEADEIAALARKELDDAQFQKELGVALSGTVPKPWP